MDTDRVASSEHNLGNFGAFHRLDIAGHSFSGFMGKDTGQGLLVGG